jgi:hypothetical protein
MKLSQARRSHRDWPLGFRLSFSARPAGRSLRHAAARSRAHPDTRLHLLRFCPGCRGKCTSTKLPTDGVTLRPIDSSASTDAAQPEIIVLDRPVDMSAVPDCSSAGNDRQSVDIERPAHPVAGVDDRLMCIHPADPEPRKPVDLRESPRHHHIRIGRDQLDARFVIVAPDILGICRVEDKDHVTGQSGMQAPDFADRNDRSRSDCSDWPGKTILVRSVTASEDAVDIGGQVIGIGNRHRRRSGGHDLDLVDQEPVFGEHPLIARRRDRSGTAARAVRPSRCRTGCCRD